VPLASAAFSFGWHDVEEQDGAPVRWMSDHAVLFNPQPERPVEQVRLVLAGAHGAAQPVLRAAFDQMPALLAMEHGRKRNGPGVATIGWPKGRPPGVVEAISLASMLHSAPVGTADGRGARNLSIAVSEVTFLYAAGDGKAVQSTVSSKRIA